MDTSDIDNYISAFPTSVQKRLKAMRAAIRKAAPGALEKLSYKMPAYTYKGMLLYFAAHSNHIGFYPFTTAMEAFREELSEYKTGKGSVQFPHDKPLSLELISEIVKFRVLENLAKADFKSKKR
jgi:uncharacterized protein YdhG (YjbR/CyaY superfamily)